MPAHHTPSEPLRALRSVHPSGENGTRSGTAGAACWLRATLTGLALCLLLGGCSAIRTVYNQADHVAAWRVDDYFDLNDEQKRMFRASFARLHAWHRATQLRAYGGFLESAATRLDRGPGMQDVAWAIDGFKDHSQVLLQHAATDAADLLATLSGQQIATARKRFERDNRKFAKERGVGASAQEQRHLRAKLDIDSIEHWCGPLDREQKARFAAMSESLSLDAALRLQERQRRQQEFVALIEGRGDAAFPARLRQWMLDWNAHRSREIDVELDRYNDARARTFIAIFEALRPDQKAKAVARLRWYVDAMGELSRDVRQQAASQAPIAQP